MVLPVRRVVLVWLGLWLALPAWGCRFDVNTVDQRPLAQRLDEVPVAFVGTVSRVMPDGTVDFQVEHLLRGVVEGQRFVIKSGKSSCDLKFAVGQRWIYGGSTLFHPSVLLASPGQPGRYLKRLDDSKLKFPVEWQTCSTNVECSTLPYGCTKTAVNTQYLVPATKKAWRVGGDPRALECVTDPSEFAQPMCIQRACGWWQLEEQR